MILKIEYAPTIRMKYSTYMHDNNANTFNTFYGCRNIQYMNLAKLNTEILSPKFRKIICINHPTISITN